MLTMLSMPVPPPIPVSLMRGRPCSVALFTRVRKELCYRDQITGVQFRVNVL
jgi:hypothetical protein